MLIGKKETQDNLGRNGRRRNIVTVGYVSEGGMFQRTFAFERPFQERWDEKYQFSNLDLGTDTSSDDSFSVLCLTHDFSGRVLLTAI